MTFEQCKSGNIFSVTNILPGIRRNVTRRKIQVTRIFWGHLYFSQCTVMILLDLSVEYVVMGLSLKESARQGCFQPICMHVYK